MSSRSEPPKSVTSLSEMPPVPPPQPPEGRRWPAAPQGVIAEEIANQLTSGDFYWCGRCKSLIPLSYWHTCDDNRTHSAPYNEYQGH